VFASTALELGQELFTMWKSMLLVLTKKYVDHLLQLAPNLVFVRWSGSRKTLEQYRGVVLGSAPRRNKEHTSLVDVSLLLSNGLYQPFEGLRVRPVRVERFFYLRTFDFEAVVVAEGAQNKNKSDSTQKSKKNSVRIPLMPLFSPPTSADKEQQKVTETWTGVSDPLVSFLFCVGNRGMGIFRKKCGFFSDF